MGKKRKASLAHQPSRLSPPQSSKLAFNSWTDIADEQDQYLLSRDEILLDQGAAAKRRRKDEDEYAKLDSNETQVLDIHPDDESEASDHQSQSGSSDDDNDDESDLDDSDGEIQRMKQAATAARARAARIKVKAGSPNDDEGEENDNINDWGTTGKDYYGADELETENAALLEEQEAKKIQSKHLHALTDADYGFEDGWFQDASTIAPSAPLNNPGLTTTHHVVPDFVVPDGAPKELQLELLHQRYPEFTPLASELLRLQPEYQRLYQQAVLAHSENPSVVSKHWVLSSYLATIAMYFALLTEPSSNPLSKVARSPVDLRDHKLMEKLLAFKALWQSIESLDEAQLADDDSDNSDDASKMEVEKPTPILNPSQPTRVLKSALKPATSRQKSLLDTDLENFTQSLEAAATSLKPLRPASAIRHANDEDVDPDFADETELTAQEAAEKAKRRRNLRFYTSQLAQKTLKRAAAGRNLGGDSEIPYRERWKDRQMRFEAEAKAKRELQGQQGQGQGQQEEKQPKAPIGKPPKASGGNLATKGVAGNSDDEYEDFVQRAKKSRELTKDQNRQSFEKQQKANHHEYSSEDEPAKGGKRKISYQIEKNKGLTSSRRKQLRNPRLKKRMQYETKMKKLGSQKAIYKGTPAGGYAGELTGIKKNLVKSIKL